MTRKDRTASKAMLESLLTQSGHQWSIASPGQYRVSGIIYHYKVMGYPTGGVWNTFESHQAFVNWLNKHQ